jgi:hypothetical protein
MNWRSVKVCKTFGNRYVGSDHDGVSTYLLAGDYLYRRRQTKPGFLPLIYICFCFLLSSCYSASIYNQYIILYYIYNKQSGLSCPRSDSYLSSILSQNGLAGSRIALFISLIFDLEHDARGCGQNSSRIWQGLLLVARVCGRYRYETFYCGEHSQHVGWKSFGA